MGLVLLHRVATLLQRGQRVYDLWDEVRELQEREHGLGADLSDEVSSTGAVCSDHFNECSQSVLDCFEQALAVIFWLGHSTLFREEGEGHEA